MLMSGICVLRFGGQGGVPKARESRRLWRRGGGVRLWAKFAKVTFIQHADRSTNRKVLREILVKIGAVTSAFDNGLADRKSAFKRLNNNIWATSYTNLVNFRLIISEFTLLNAQFLPRFARNSTTIFICHVGVSKWIERSQFSF